jgi:hypothetical protein
VEERFGFERRLISYGLCGDGGTSQRMAGRKTGRGGTVSVMKDGSLRRSERVQEFPDFSGGKNGLDLN